MLKIIIVLRIAGRKAGARKWWEDWIEIALPPESLDPEEYAAQLRSKGIKMSQPLASKLYNREYVVGPEDGATWLKNRNLIEDQCMLTEFPITRAVSGNSVVTDFNPNPAR